MPANTDLFRKVAPNTGWQLNASGIADASVTSFVLVSSTNLPTDTAVTLTVDRVDSSGTKTPTKMERIKGIVSGANVISCVRGVGGTAQAHGAGAVVEIVIDSTLWNDFISGILTFSTQLGKLLQSAVDSISYAADAGGDDTYSVTLDPVPAAYYTGMTVTFKPTTANTGACTLDVNGLGAKTIKKNVSTDLATGDILAGQMVMVKYDGTNFQLVSTIPVAVLNVPQGFLINGKIVPSVAASDLTVAIKTLAGADPSASDPVYCRIGDTVRTITAALSVTKNDATNWFNSGSTELATKEIDYFVYLGYNATDGVVIGFSRIPSANSYDDFSTTTTNEKYCAISTITTAAATDYYEVIGRFAATLSAGAGYTWSVPTFTAKNLIQRPIYETRWLTQVFSPTITGTPPTTPADTSKYKLIGNACTINQFVDWTNAGTGVTNVFTKLPFSSKSGALSAGMGFTRDGSGINRPVNRVYIDTNMTVDIVSQTLKQYGAITTYEI